MCWLFPPPAVVCLPGALSTVPVMGVAPSPVFRPRCRRAMADGRVPDPEAAGGFFSAACWVILCACGLCQALHPASPPVKPAPLTPPERAVGAARRFLCCVNVSGRQRGLGETLGTPFPPAPQEGGLGRAPVAWIWQEKDFFLMENVLKAKGAVSSCPARLLPSGSFLLY